jgi:hypothetical protein
MLLVLKWSLLAAVLQLTASIAVTFGLAALDSGDVIGRQGSQGDISFCQYYTQLLVPGYLLLAAGFALWISNKAVVAVPRLQRSLPSDERERIAALFAIPAVLIWALALRPAEIVIELSNNLSSECLVRMIWAAVMSMRTTFLGATANSLFCVRRDKTQI